jgi:hypothetical protein
MTMLLPILSQAALALGVQTYRVQRLPAPDHTDPTACALAAADLGERFAAATGLAPAATRCVRDGGRYYDLEITYLADQALPVVTTAPRDGDVLDRGPFTSPEACAEGLPAQAEQFRAETGLEPVVAACRMYEDPGGRRYAHWIEGLGAAAHAPHVFAEETYYGYPLDRTTDLAARIRTALEARGVSVYRVSVGLEIITTQLVVGYYAPAEIALDLHGPYVVTSADRCRALAASLAEPFAAAGEAALAGWCTNDSITSGFAAYVFADATGSRLREQVAAPTFADLDACDADRARIEDLYRTGESLDVVGSVCTRIPDATGEYEYKVTLFSRAAS